MVLAEAAEAVRCRPRPAPAPPPTTTTPYDVTGWTLPIQMGVEVVAVTQPVSDATRASLRKIDRVEPIQGKVEGIGPGFRVLAQFEQRGATAR